MIGWLLGSRLGRVSAAIFGFVSVLFAAFFMGRREGGQIGKRKAKDNWIKTRKRMDDAEIYGDDPAAARRWLHERQSDSDM